MKQIPVLDKGYVRLVTYLPWNMVELSEALESGDFERAQTLLVDHDLAEVNAARTSFKKESTALVDADVRLLNFLGRRDETSPTRHTALTLEIKAPIMVRAQWFKYRVGGDHWPEIEVGNGDDGGFSELFHARNEMSRRYVTEEPEFYIPEHWRLAPDNKKQGSGENVNSEIGAATTAAYQTMIEMCVKDYKTAMDRFGIAPEMARLFLPYAAMYTTWRWTCSVQAVALFLRERLEHKAQYEIQAYAQAVYELVKPIYPHAIRILVEEKI